jgi:hypothetical protein
VGRSFQRGPLPSGSRREPDCPSLCKKLTPLCESPKARWLSPCTQIVDNGRLLHLIRGLGSSSTRFNSWTKLHLNRGFPFGACLRFKCNATPEMQAEISLRINCSSLRFKCNSLLHLNRGFPGSAVYDLSTARQQGHVIGWQIIENALVVFDYEGV